MEKESFIKKWLRGDLSTEEQEEFDNSEEFRLLSKIDSSLKQFKAPEYIGDTSFIEDLEHNGLSQSPLRRNVKLYISIAASVVLLCSVATYMYFNMNEDQVLVDSFSQKSIYLPDSSLVKLNTGSTISYSPNNWDSNRNINLKGEAFFKVSKGSNFKVKTNKGIVTVLGTQFNVINRNKFMEVTCFEGKVNVTANETSVDLVKGDSYRIVDNIVTQRKIAFNSRTTPTWLKGETKFISLPVSFVLKEFERQYNVTFNTKDIDTNSLISGSFVHRDMKIALESISIPLNCTYKIAKGRITLVSKDTH